MSNRDVGSAGVLAAYLQAAQAGQEDRTILVHAGDHVGASPPASALLQDEPSITLLNLFANEHCDDGRGHPRCVDVVSRLDDAVDVVVSGHSHSLTNALLPTASGKPVLVTQAFSAGTAYGDIDLEIDRRTGDVVSKEAWIATTWPRRAGPRAWRAVRHHLFTGTSRRLRHRAVSTVQADQTTPAQR